MIEIDLRRQQALDADAKAMQQVKFTGNIDQAGNKTTFFVIEKGKINLNCNVALICNDSI